MSRLTQIQAAAERPTNLKAAHADADQVLCDTVHVFRFCLTPLTPEKITNYLDGRAAFLGALGCQDAAIARGIARWHIQLPEIRPAKDIAMALAKHITTIPEKDCPGWATLPTAQKDSLRELAAGKTSAP